MNAFPIRNDDDLARAFARIDELWGVEDGTAEADELEVMVTLVEAYEREHTSLPQGDPIEVILYKLRELELSQRELGRRLGWGSGRASEILNRRRPLTLGIIRQVAAVLGIPVTALMGEEATGSSGLDLQLPPALLARAESLARGAGVTVADWVTAAVLQAVFRGALTVVTANDASPDTAGTASCEVAGSVTGLRLAA
jgi:HTH-type transcriptional regulator/antitoxin HigA